MPTISTFGSRIARDYARRPSNPCWTGSRSTRNIRSTSTGKIRHFRSPACAAGVLPRGLFRGLRTYLRLPCRMADVGTRPVCACHGARAELARIPVAARGLSGVLWAGTYREPSVFRRIPDQGVIAGDAGWGHGRCTATRDSLGTYAMVYSESGRPFAVDLGRVSGKRIVAWWYDVRSGRPLRIGEFRRRDAVRR